METNDNTLLEMQQQMKQLREKLENQKIVNDRIMKKSMSQTIGRLRLKSNIPIFAGVFAILLSPSMLGMGLPLYFVIFTDVLMLICIAATVLTNNHLPRIDRDMVTAAGELGKFKKIHADWIKFGFPMLAVWLGLLIWSVVKCLDLDRIELFGFISGLAVGIIVGVLVGLKARRDLINDADDLLSQIEELKKD